MRVLTQPLKELAEFDTMLGSLQKAAREGKGVCLSLSGCTDSQKLHMMHGLGEGFRNKLLVTYSDKRVREIAEEFSFYERNVMTFPARDLIFYQADIHGNELVTQRMKVLRRLLDGSPVTVVTTFDAL
ncbi:MAG: transcription-repair coupling factor, partial [Lachnospiraceae bacterium]|nr:transcription-repair coupling factor [Lachnospiraceae bacterium]